MLAWIGAVAPLWNESLRSGYREWSGTSGPQELHLERAVFTLRTDSLASVTNGLMIHRFNPASTRGGPKPLAPEDIVAWPERTSVLPWVYADRPWPDATMAWVRVQTFGWPMRAFSIELQRTFEMSTGMVAGPAGAGAWRRKPWDDWPTVLPSCPMVVGATVDTALYSSLAWLGLFGWRDLLRSRRHRAGHCTSCGYDLRGVSTASPCPECGTHRPGLQQPTGLDCRADDLLSPSLPSPRCPPIPCLARLRSNPPPPKLPSST